MLKVSVQTSRLLDGVIDEEVGYDAEEIGGGVHVVEPEEICCSEGA